MRSFEISYFCADQLLAQPDLLRILMGKKKYGGTPAGGESVVHKLMDAMSSAQKLRGCRVDPALPR